MKSRRSGKGLRSVGCKNCYQGCFTVFPLSHLHSDKKEEMFDFCLYSLLLKEPRSFLVKEIVYMCVCVFMSASVCVNSGHNLLKAQQKLHYT